LTLLLTIPQVTSVSTLNNVILKNYATAPIISKFTSLFPGLGYAAGYKVCDFALDTYWLSNNSTSHRLT
jgi:hypothetical protein